MYSFFMSCTSSMDLLLITWRNEEYDERKERKFLILSSNICNPLIVSYDSSVPLRDWKGWSRNVPDTSSWYGSTSKCFSWIYFLSITYLEVVMFLMAIRICYCWDEKYLGSGFDRSLGVALPINFFSILISLAIKSFQHMD